LFGIIGNGEARDRTAAAAGFGRPRLDSTKPRVAARADHETTSEPPQHA